MRLTFTNKSESAFFFNGYLFYKDTLMDQPGNAIFFASGDFDDFKEHITASNGCFALTVIKDNELWAAVDRRRSYPLFYGQKNGQFFLSDDPYWVKQKLGDTQPDPQASAEYWYMLYVLRDRTLAPSVKQLRAGQLLRVQSTVDGFKTQTVPYYRYLHSDSYEMDQDQLLPALDEVSINVFQRLLKSARGRPIIVPLSGGLDSRFIVCMLKRLGADNVRCFSYGTPGCPEARISHHIAESLGYPWTFISYRDFDWDAPDLQQDRQQFFRFASNLSAMPPILEDWLAVRTMKKQGKLPDDAIFCPGHSGNFISGGYIKPPILSAKDEHQLTKLILNDWSPRMHWQMPDPDTLTSIKQNILETLTEMQTGCHWDPVKFANCWDWQEYEVKRIIPLVKTYTFWGYGWRIPLWDAEMMDFWSRIPTHLYLDKRLYQHYFASYSDSKFFGLYNFDLPELNLAYPGRFPPIHFLHKLLRYHTLTRYFFEYKRMVLRLLTKNYFDYLRIAGKRIFYREPVTYSWVFMDKYGLDSIWNADQYAPQPPPTDSSDVPVTVSQEAEVLQL